MAGKGSENFCGCWDGMRWDGDMDRRSRRVSVSTREVRLCSGLVYLFPGKLMILLAWILASYIDTGLSYPRYTKLLIGEAG